MVLFDGGGDKAERLVLIRALLDLVPSDRESERSLFVTAKAALIEQGYTTGNDVADNFNGARRGRILAEHRSLEIGGARVPYPESAGT